MQHRRDALVATVQHPIHDESYAAACRSTLDANGALILRGFFTESAISSALAESVGREAEAFYAASTHNVYLTPPDPSLGPDHAFNRQVPSSKGLLADDQIPADSVLRLVYDDPVFQRFLCRVLDIDQIHPYADPLSCINVHFASSGRQLGWHFDNSSFAVTMLLQAPISGGNFEYVANARNAAAGDQGFEVVDRALDGTASTETLEFSPGDLVLFRGRDALHRVTPTEGEISRVLVVFAYNDEPGVSLSDSALETFYGRHC